MIPKLDEPELLFENRDFRVFNKPSGWHSIDGKTKALTLETWIRKKFDLPEALPEAGLVHRLDQMTSGCILAAKNTAAFNDLQHRFRKSIGVQKIYWALTHQSKGARPPLEFQLYFSSRYKSSKKVTVKDAGAKRELGLCRMKILMKVQNDYLFEVELDGPGQRHQIRAGLSHLGFPIVGDKLYGGPERGEIFGLHSYQLTIGTHKIQAPPPPHWYDFVPLEKIT